MEFAFDAHTHAVPTYAVEYCICYFQLIVLFFVLLVAYATSSQSQCEKNATLAYWVKAFTSTQSAD